MPYEEMVANFLTKLLQRDLFGKFWSKIVRIESKRSDCKLDSETNKKNKVMGCRKLVVRGPLKIIEESVLTCNLP